MADISTATSSSRLAERPGRTGGPGQLLAILWRLHFLTGFLAAPVVVWLCLTGILFAWNPQIESVLHRRALTATAEGDARRLSEQVAAVTAAYPEHEVVEVLPAAGPGKTTGVVLQPRGAEGAAFEPAPGLFTAYVDPVTATIRGRIRESNRPDEWLRNLHSNFRLGTRAGTLTELAASLVLVSLLTGLYLWWPTTRSGLRRALVPRWRGLRGGGRLRWRDLHSAVGVVALGAVAMMVTTGLTWTEYAGRWVDVAKDTLMKEAPTLRTDLAASAAAGDSSTVSEHAEHAGGTGGTGPSMSLVQVDRVAALADDAGLALPYTITPPEEAGKAWSVQEIDRRWPIREATIAVDPARGTVVDRLVFADQPLLDQATTLGISFHQAELFGLANQLGLTLLALALLVIVASGYVMWWRRRPAGGLGAPPKVGPLLRTVPLPLLAGFAALMVLLPTLGVAFFLYLFAERIVRTRRRRAPVA